MLIKERVFGETTYHIIYLNDNGKLTLRYKFADGSNTHIRTLDQYETEMVLAAWENGYFNGKEDEEFLHAKRK